MAIRIVVTGGTFDKEYDELTGRLYFLDTHVPEMLRRGRCRLDVVVETEMMVDSLDLDDEGRAEIVARCRSSAEREIVVTHGTDTMVKPHTRWLPRGSTARPSCSPARWCRTRSAAPTGCSISAARSRSCRCFCRAFTLR